MLLAPRCAACEVFLDAPSRGPVCSTCWDSIRLLRAPRCGRCGNEHASWSAAFDGDACFRCRRLPPVVSISRAAGDYDGALRKIIHAFKYQGRRSLARPLGRLIADTGGVVLDGASCVVPVPLHPFRRLHRGFNQARDLARTLPLPVVPALWRTRATAPQERLTAAGRRRNVRDAFRLSPLMRERTRRELIEDRVVVLVDDVRTTGATLDQCARVLRDAGAREVRALTVASTRPHSSYGHGRVEVPRH